MFEEAATSFKDYFKERSVSPLFGMFTASWLAWNWEAISIFFLDESPIVAKIELLKRGYSDHSSLIYGPALTASILIIVYPVLSGIAHVVWKFFSVKKENILSGIENGRMLTLEQAIQIRKDIANIKAEKEREVSARDGIISQLEAALKSALPQSNDIVEDLDGQSSTQKTEATLDTEDSWHKEYINLNANVDNSNYFDQLEHFGSGTQFINGKKFILSKYAQKHLVEHGYLTTKGGDLALTPKGAFVVEGIRKARIKAPVIGRVD